jgi:hypothetical protein
VQGCCGYWAYLVQRFTHREIEALVQALHLPEQIKANNGIKEPGKVALCMLLDHLCAPDSLKDAHLKFGWKPERVSRITNTLMSIIHDKWKHLLSWPGKLLTQARLTMYSALVAAIGAPLRTAWGFVDGTLHHISRPGFA